MAVYAFIGVGNMASAIIRGLGERTDIVLYDKNPAQYEKFTAPCYQRAASPADAVSRADRIVLSVKPQNMDEVLADIASSNLDLKQKTFISIAAGVPIEKISGALGSAAVIRTMPNTPLMIGQGVTALCRNEEVTDEAFDETVALFGSLGKTTVLDEKDLNAIISVTSSSPAYVYLFIKALCDGAREQGLDPENLTELVCGMVAGSAAMVMQSGKTPEELIRMVTSPNGTTERAMKVLYEKDMEGMVKEAMLACTARAEELSKL